MEQPSSSTSRPRKSPIPNPKKFQNPSHVQSDHQQNSHQIILDDSQRPSSSSLNSSTSQLRPQNQGYQGMAMTGSLGSSSVMRPGVFIMQPSTPVQPSVQSQPTTTGTTQSGSFQYSHGRGLLNLSSMGYPVSPSPNTTQNTPPPNRPWLSSGLQVKPPLPTPSQSLQQGSHISQQQQISPSEQLQQPLLSHKHKAPIKPPKSKPLQKHIKQKPIPSLTSPQKHIAEFDESCTTILSKRSIHELLNQIDPSTKLDPDVEDILVDIVDDFVESITTFGCLLAKHRKSTTLEPKDILLHLERNWHMTIPGFGENEIMSYINPIANDTHTERLAVIKK